MRNIFKPSSLFFIFTSVVVAFGIGILIAILVGAGKGQMLASGAIVLFYGIVGAILAFFISIFLITQLETKMIHKYNRLLGLLFALFVVFVLLRWFTMDNDDGTTEDSSTPTEQMGNTNTLEYPIRFTTSTSQDRSNTMGIGFFKPNFFDHPTLYFFENINLEKSLDEHLPADSLVFAQDPTMVITTTYAPPWLFPEHLKLDYGVLIFKVLGEGHDFVKVEANRSTGRITYINKYQGTLMSWSEFLLSINSVEFNEGSPQKIYTKPLHYAGEIATPHKLMKPLLVEGEWMYVQLINEKYEEVGKGWIQWHEGQKLLITYSLFS